MIYSFDDPLVISVFLILLASFFLWTFWASSRQEKRQAEWFYRIQELLGGQGKKPGIFEKTEFRFSGSFENVEYLCEYWLPRRFRWLAALRVVCPAKGKTGEFQIIKKRSWIFDSLRRPVASKRVIIEKWGFGSKANIFSNSPKFTKAYLALEKNRRLIEDIFELGFHSVLYDGETIEIRHYPDVSHFPFKLKEISFVKEGIRQMDLLRSSVLC